MRRHMVRYAATHCALYTLMVLVGAMLPVRVLISFEMLLAACAPSAILCVWINVQRYLETRSRLDQAMLGAWGWLALTIAAYYTYLVSGWTQRLWARGIWFSENDVLHIGLIAWMLYLMLVVAKLVTDQRETPPAAAADTMSPSATT